MSMQHSAPVVVIVLLVLFSIYRRTRRTIGFQKLVTGRMATRMVLLAIAGVIILVTGILTPMVYMFDAIGIVVGGLIAYYAIRTTAFEWRNEAWFYRQNPWISVLLLVLFVGRIVYRVYQDYVLFGATTSVHGKFANHAELATYSHDPLTSIILFALVTYYIVYYTFLIRKGQHLEMEMSGGNR
jgi:hypothetical protein